MIDSITFSIRTFKVYCLLASQWDNGMIPHETSPPYSTGLWPYYNQIAYRGLWQRPLEGTPESNLTSGITQPPILANAARRVYDVLIESNQPNRQEFRPNDDDEASRFAKRSIAALVDYHSWLYETRLSPSADNAVAIINPYETGMDDLTHHEALMLDKPASELGIVASGFVMLRNVIVSSGILDRTASNPNVNLASYEFGLRSHLLSYNHFRKYRYDSRRILDNNPYFALESTSFNAFLIDNTATLLQWIGDLGMDTPSYLENANNRNLQSFVSNFWDEDLGQFVDRTIDGQQLNSPNAGGLIPLVLADRLPKKIVERLLQTLTDDYWTAVPVPTLPQEAGELISDRYNNNPGWQGGVWSFINYTLINALERAKQFELADDLSHRYFKSLAKHAATGIDPEFLTHSGQVPPNSSVNFAGTIATRLWLASRSSAGKK